MVNGDISRSALSIQEPVAIVPASRQYCQRQRTKEKPASGRLSMGGLSAGLVDYAATHHPGPSTQKKEGAFFFLSRAPNWALAKKCVCVYNDGQWIRFH
jgi:hypothetical protein